MPQVKIPAEQFKRLILATKPCVSTDCSRPALSYIQFRITKTAIIASAINGYQAARAQMRASNEDEFVVYIKPITFAINLKRIDYVIIELDSDNNTIVRVPQNYGVVSYTFSKLSGTFIDIDKLFDDVSADVSPVVALDASLVAHSLQSFTGAKVCDKYFGLYATKNTNRPVLMRAKSDDITLEQLLLPVRGVLEEDRL